MATGRTASALALTNSIACWARRNGAVYLAHRADGRFEQHVAVKLIELPVATNLFKERLRQERRILAACEPLFAQFRLLDRIMRINLLLQDFS